MISSFLVSRGRQCAVGLLLACVGGCSALRSTGTPPPAFYALERVRIETAAARPAPVAPANGAPALVVNPPRAAAGFDSQRILYVREPYQLEYFAHSEWVDPPARMLAPLIVAAAENSGTFRSVILAPTAAAGDLRLDTEIVRLQQDFATQPSRVHFTLRAHLVDNATRRVLAWRLFDASVAAATDDPYGGVVAANRAVQTVLEQLAGFCATAAAQWQPATPVLP
ncbi:MAG: ABC-type transport auxiliary lipoprotein family protein [Candidatus Accumulibacter phosphatis]|jgi:cholesterol transport system auxiliary component|uniref:ABC-type transport auxiliary lipoprotein family protein n=1 Tax=Candidatus Accumulibacter contiguus TaxID=2954381 RepID=UPI002FC2F665